MKIILFSSRYDKIFLVRFTLMPLKYKVIPELRCHDFEHLPPPVRRTNFSSISTLKVT